jgi:hypothetical protein
VTSVTPANGTANVAINQKLTATFSEPMNNATITAGTFTLTGPFTTPVNGSVIYDIPSRTATFTPSGNLANNTTYTATISTGAMNPAGTALASPFVWSFSTALVPDTTAPLVSFTAPANNELGVLINRKIVATFNEAMDPATIIAANVSVTGPSGIVSGAVTYAAGSNAMTFTPASSLATNSTYTVTIFTGVKDLAGNAMAADYAWSFITADAPDTTGPRVSSTNPADLAVNVPLDKIISATFSEAMDPLTIITANFMLLDGVTPVPGTVAYDVPGNIMTFTPLSPLAFSTTYTAQISTGATDLAGNSLVSGAVPNPWSFTTAAAPAVPTAINLRSAASFAIAARSGLASTGVNVVNGDVALWLPSPTCTDATGIPANCAVNPKPASATGLTVNGSIYYAGDVYDNGGTANSVTNDVNIAWTEGMNKADTQGAVAADEMGGKTLFAGVYHNAAALGLATGATCTLDAQGDANAVFIFKVGSSFTSSGTIASPSEIKLINGAQARNVWLVTNVAVTIGPGTKWNGNILAGGPVTIYSGSTVNGRVFGGAAGTAGAVTLTGAPSPDITTITVP